MPTKPEIQQMCVPLLARLKANGLEFATSSDIFKEMRLANPLILKTWHGNGAIAAIDGICKAIGDALGDSRGGLYLPCVGSTGTSKRFDLRRIDIIGGRIVIKALC